MAKTHKDIDWEYIVESIAQRRYFSKVNDNATYPLEYSQLKNIAEEEVFYYMEHENDTLRKMRERIYFRYRHRLTNMIGIRCSGNWREDEYFIHRYERELKRKFYW